MRNNVLVIAEQRDGILKKVAFEMLGAGIEIAAAPAASPVVRNPLRSIIVSPLY